MIHYIHWASFVETAKNGPFKVAPLATGLRVLVRKQVGEAQNIDWSTLRSYRRRFPQLKGHFHALAEIHKMKQISDVRISDTDASFVLLCRKFRRIKLFHDDRRILLKFKLQNAFSTVYTPFEIHVEMINCLANEMICIYIITGGTREEINKQKVHFR